MEQDLYCPCPECEELVPHGRLFVRIRMTSSWCGTRQVQIQGATITAVFACDCGASWSLLFLEESP
jgi:hypothetical protein